VKNTPPDLPRAEAERLWASQRGTSTAAFNTPSQAAAWKTIPSCHFISTGDQIITATSKLAMAPLRALAHHPVPRRIAPDPDLAPERGHRCHRVGDLLASLTTPPDPREPRSPAPARRGEAEANQENGLERDHGSD
jgi:hypothetical protein